MAEHAAVIDRLIDSYIGYLPLTDYCNPTRDHEGERRRYHSGKPLYLLCLWENYCSIMDYLSTVLTFILGRRVMKEGATLVQQQAKTEQSKANTKTKTGKIGSDHITDRFEAIGHNGKTHGPNAVPYPPPA